MKTIGALILLRRVAEQASQLGVNWLIQSTVLIGLGLLLARLFRGRGSAAQSVIYRTTLVAVLACPLATWAMTYTSMKGLTIGIPALWSLEQRIDDSDTTAASFSSQTDQPQQDTGVPVEARSQAATLKMQNPPGRAVLSPQPVAPVPNPFAVSSTTQVGNTQPAESLVVTNKGMTWLAGALMIVWLSVSSWLLIRLAVAWSRIWHLRRSAMNVAPSTVRMCREIASLMRVSAPDVRQCAFISSPSLVGCLHPMILLPEGLRESALRVVLIHELAHLRRHDTYLNLLRRMATCVFFFQPLLWRLSFLLEATSEDVCDDIVIQLSSRRDFYAKELVEFAAGSAIPVAALGISMIGRRSMLARRVARIMDSSRNLSTRAGKQLLLSCLVGGFVSTLLMGLIVNGSTPVAAQDSEQVEETRPADQGIAATDDPSAADDPAPSAASRNVEIGNGRIEGTVVLQSDGTQVANADVRLLKQGRHIGPLKPVRARSDAQGRFEISDVQPGKYRLWAFHNDLMSRDKRMQGLEIEVDETGKASLTPKLDLWPGNRLKVHVVSRMTNQPLENARIRLTWTDTDRDHFTDSNGDVEILGLTPEPWQIETVAAEHAEETQRISLNAGQLLTEVNVALSAGGELTGTVIDAAGQPLADVGISIFPANHQGPQIEYMKTDGGGRFAFPYLPLSELEILLSKDDYSPQRQTVVLTSPERKKTLQMTLDGRPYGGGVLVKVRNEQGEPIAGASIKNHGRSSRDERTGTTDDQGDCLLENLFLGSIGHEIIVRAKGYAPLAVTCRPGPKDAPTEVPVVLQPGHSLTGRVLLSDGTPASGQWVFFAEGEHGIGGIGGRTTTDKEGRFAFDSLPKPCTFTFYAPTGHSRISDLELTLDGEDEVVVQLEAAAAVRGRVVDAETGEPVSDFNVKLTFCREREPGDPELDWMPGDLSNPGSDFADPKGMFAIEGLLRRCPYQAMIEAPGYERLIVERIVAIQSSDQLSEIKLTRVNPEAYRVVSGLLTAADGSPMSGVQVRLLATKGQRSAFGRFPFNWTMIESGQIERMPECVQFLSATTDQAGRFNFPMVKRDVDLDLFYWGSNAAPARLLDLESRFDNLTNIEIIAYLAAKLTVSFDRNVFPDASAITVTSSTFGDRNISVSDKEREYTVDGLGSEAYNINLEGQPVRTGASSFTRGSLASKTIELKPGEHAHASFTAAEKTKP